MPRSNIGARAQPGSNPPVKPPREAAPPSPQFTESQQESSPDGPDRSENSPESAEWLSLDATEPFPNDLFRVPVPNAVFGRMPEMSDSALRCLLALVHRSFRFDPAEGEWVHPGDWFNRSDVEDECGLSNQGTRDGLNELESVGWVRADRSGRTHWFQLALEVPSQQFTYVPTALLEDASGIGSGTALRVVLAVLRETWGWTGKETDPQSGDLHVVHDRWAQLSTQELAEKTGRSKTAVTQAANALQGEWIERVRPGSGAFQYRFLPEAISDGSGDPDSFCGENANDLPPDRQKSDPPSFNKESSSKDKHSQTSTTNGSGSDMEPVADGEDAVPPTKQPQDRSDPGGDRSKPEKSRQQSPTADFSDVPPEKRDLAEKLHNVGVWPGRIAELLSRFIRARIDANFELYRRRAAEQTIRKPGAWLCEAITEGYALPSPDSETTGRGPTNKESTKSPLASLEHKETVSEEKKDAYVAQGVGEDRFHRCPSGQAGPEERRFMYFDPDVGGPARRR
jgi:hypothetical protein